MLLRDSDVCITLADMADNPTFQHKSGRDVRQVYMGFVIRLSNLIQKRAELDNLVDLLPDQLKSTEWRLFINGELENSNKNN